MRVRVGSAERVVLPVPDRPKNRAVCPSGPMLAEQCIDITPCVRQHVVHHGEHRLLDLARVLGAADEDQMLSEVEDDEGLGAGAFRLGSALKEGTSTTAKSGLKPASSLSEGRIKRLRAKRFAQAVSV